MAERGKKYKEKAKLIEAGKSYSPDEAVKLVKAAAPAKFDESVDVALKLNIDPKKDSVRGTVLLPAGSGKSVKVGVITKGDKIKEAEEAGADFVGGTELIDKIQGGWLDFDVLISTPDMMSQVGKLGKLLGQKGLMPNPKAGTVSADVGKTVKEFKAGKTEFKADKTGVIHVKIGRASFEEGKLKENLNAVLSAVIKAKPPKVSGTYIESATISSTMGPGIRVDARRAEAQ